MKREDLERNLELGYQFGFPTETCSPDFRGWLLIEKRKPNASYLSRLEPGEEPETVAEQELIRQKPYRVRVIELDRAVHESDSYETSSDYRLDKRYDFSSLEDVETFIHTEFGYTLQSVKWRSELDAP